MLDIEQLAREYSALTRDLKKWDYFESAKLAGGLATIPELHANTLRIEMLAHLVALTCDRNKIPSHETCADWIGPKMASSMFALQEDSPEDIFIGYICSKYGGFRVFAGIFAFGHFWLERLIAFLSEKENFPPQRFVTQ